MSPLPGRTTLEWHFEVPRGTVPGRIAVDGTMLPVASPGAGTDREITGSQT